MTSRAFFLGALTAAALALVGGALASASYTDPTGDPNSAPDISSVSVAESPGDAYVVRLALRDAATLPASSGLVILFDLDLKASTGANGAEAAVRYSSDGALSVARWNGFDMAAASADGVQASFADGVLTVTIQRPALAGASTFGITGLASRLQTVAGTRLVASDFVPDTGSNVFSPPGPKAFPDSEGDQDMAPDISTISVSDGQNGTIAFRVTTANYRVLGADKLVGLGFELVGRPADSDEVFITYQGGPEESIIIERELEGFLTQDTPPDRATARFDDGVLTIDVHRTELDDVARFRFGVVTADLVGDAEGEDDDSLGDIESVDFSPEELQPEMLHRYALEHRPPVRLTVGRPSGLPTVPRSGKAFTVRVVVTRSDTGTAVRSGTVSCNAFVGKARVVAKGRFRAGRAQCSLVVPARHRSNRVRGTMTIRAAGASVRSGFSFVVG